jgi:hypothetical protein
VDAADFRVGELEGLFDLTLAYGATTAATLAAPTSTTAT